MKWGKNKKLTYVLLPVTLVVWGMIGFQLWGTQQGEQVPVSLPNNFSGSMITPQPDQDTLTLIADYRDPFLGKWVKPPAVAKTATVTTSLKEKPSTPKLLLKAAPSITWPKVVYSGLVKNKTTQLKLALVKINGVDQLMKEGDQIDSISVISIANDSISLVMARETKIFHKTKQADLLLETSKN